MGSGKVWRTAMLMVVWCAMPAVVLAQLHVSVRESSGNPLKVEATIRLTAISGNMNGVSTSSKEVQTNGGEAVIDVWPGEYVVEAEAPGYQKASEQTAVPAGSYTVRLYLAPGREAGESVPAPSGVVMTPALAKEMEKASSALAQRNLKDARKYLSKALELAPSNPDALYLLGVVEYTEKNIPAARKDFQDVLARYPEHGGSLLMLGQIKLETGEKQVAVTLLEKAVAATPDKWSAHELLANAYARTGQLEKAWAEAEKTSELNREKLPAMRILEVKILLKQKKNAEAEEALAAFVKEFPNDPAAKAAQEKLAEMRAADSKKP